MLTRRILIKSGLLTILSQFILTFSEAGNHGAYPKIPSKDIESKCFDILYAALQNDDEFPSKHNVIAALGELGNPACVPLLIKELNCPGMTRNEEIAFVLAKFFGEKRGVEYLAESLNSDNCVFKRDARNFLCELYGIPIPKAPQRTVLSPDEVKEKIEEIKDSDDLLTDSRLYG